MSKKIPFLQLPQEIREKQRNHKNLQAEEDPKIACIEDNTINSLKLLHESFPKVNST